MNYLKSTVLRNTIMIMALVFIWTTAQAGAAQAGDLDNAIGAYEKQNYSEALGLFTPLAEAGDKSAQNYLGIMYQSGYGVDVNHNEAVKW